MEILKQVTDSVDMKYATKENVCRYYLDIYNALNIKCQDRMYKKCDIKMYIYSLGCI